MNRYVFVPLIVVAYLAVCVAVGKVLKRAGAHYPQQRPEGFVVSCGDTLEWCDSAESAGELAVELWGRPDCGCIFVHPVCPDEIESTS